MAILPPADDGIVFQMTNIDRQVLIIKNPGFDDEEVILRFEEDWTPVLLQKYIDMINNCAEFSSAKQMYHALVWLGYFYRSFVR
jgi:hypothetical protein